MEVYDPEINPGKTLEETIQNFINWTRMSNRNTARVLRSVNEKLIEISRTEETLKTLETSQIAGLDKIEKMLTLLSRLIPQNNPQDEATDSYHQLRLAISSLNSQLKYVTISISNYQETMESEFTLGMNKIEGAILDIKSDIASINSQLQVPAQRIEPTASTKKNLTKKLNKNRKQIICKTEQDKARILSIIDRLIENLSKEKSEISGLAIKKRFIEARKQVYEQTEGLAPRFRKMMDDFAEVIHDETFYPVTALEPFIMEGIRYIREIYQSAPVGQTNQ